MDKKAIHLKNTQNSNQRHLENFVNLTQHKEIHTGTKIKVKVWYRTHDVLHNLNLDDLERF